MGGAHVHFVKPASVVGVSENDGPVRTGQHHGVNMPEPFLVESGISAPGVHPKIGSGAWEKPPTDIAASRHGRTTTIRG